MNGTIYFVRRGKGCWGEVDHCEQDPREVGRGVLYPSCWWQYLEQPHNELDDSVTLRCIYSSWMEGRLGMLPWRWWDCVCSWEYGFVCSIIQTMKKQDGKGNILYHSMPWELYSKSKSDSTWYVWRGEYAWNQSNSRRYLSTYTLQKGGLCSIHHYIKE